METQYLKTLVIAAEEGSFSRTAQRLHLTQSAVSQRIKALEELYGQQLLQRSASRLTPTRLGRYVIDKGRDILSREAELIEAVRSYGQEKRLALCTTPTFAFAFLPRILPEFLQLATPPAQFRVQQRTSQETLQGIREREFDVAVVEHCDECAMREFQAWVLQPDELVFISPPDSGLPLGEVSIEQLLSWPLCLRQYECSAKKVLRSNMVQTGRDVEDFAAQYVIEDLATTLQMVDSGQALAFVSKSLLSLPLAAGMKWHTVAGFRQLRQRHLVLPYNATVDHVLQTLVDTVCSLCGPAPESLAAQV